MTAHKLLKSQLSQEHQHPKQSDAKQYASWIFYAAVAFFSVIVFFGGIALLFSSEVL